MRPCARSVIIAALGSAEVDVGTPIGNTTALAFANGIYAEADTLTGNVTNAGLINVSATATNNDQTALAVAGANGMLLDVGIFGAHPS